jgi:phosphatidylglycerol:prolipoprotein diacylglycerol transferase
MNFGTQAINLGPVEVGYFGLIVVAAIAVGAFITRRAAVQCDIDPAPLLLLIEWGLFGGLILARLFYILNPPPSVAAIYDRAWFLSHPFDVQVGPLAVWSGGLGMAGALLGAALAITFRLVRAKLDRWQWADLFVPGALTGLIISPWANVVNRQLYGPPTYLPWGIVVRNPVPPYDNLELFPQPLRFHPTPAYLSIWAALTLAAIWLIRRRFSDRLHIGDTFLLAALFYGIGVFLADFLRVDVSRPLLGLSVMQLLALAIVVWAIATGGWRLSNRAKRPENDMVDAGNITIDRWE